MVRGPVPSSRSLRWLTNVVIVLAVVAFALIVWTLVSLRGQVAEQSVDLHRADTARRSLADAVAKQGAALDKANQRLVNAGKQPVPTPPTPAAAPTVTEPGPAGATGPQGPVGPQGPQGLMGLIGLTGPQGKTGPAGAAGPTGPTGQQGPPPSDDQVSAAVRAYCATHDACAGPSGPMGPKGDTGAAGKDGVDGKDGATGPAGPKGDPGTATPGTYACDSGQYVTGITIADDGTLTLTCAGLLPPGQSQQGATP